MNHSNSEGIAELRAENLVYEINDQMILNELSFSVKAGEVLFIEGGNGSGKTTLIRILCGLIEADEGKVCWNGEDIQRDRLDCYQQLTYIGHTTGVKQELSSLENMKFFSALSGLPAKEDFQEAIEWAGLKNYKHSPGRHLSYGQQRRIALTRLKIDSSLLWILDEPFSGLDKKMIECLQACFIEHVNNGGLLVLTSHQHIDLGQVNTVRIQLQN